jgi:lysozyme family protein
MSSDSISKYNSQFNTIGNFSNSSKSSIAKNCSSKTSFKDFSKEIAAQTATDLHKTLENKKNFEANIDGYLGTDTFKAVKSFQNNNMGSINNSDIIKAIQAKMIANTKSIPLPVKFPKKYTLPIPFIPKKEI